MKQEKDISEKYPVSKRKGSKDSKMCYFLFFQLRINSEMYVYIFYFQVLGYV